MVYGEPSFGTAFFVYKWLNDLRLVFSDERLHYIAAMQL